MSWIERKSVESQLRNTTYGVHQLVAAANVLTAAWGAGKQPSPEALAEFQRRKNKLVSDMHGLAGVSQLRRVLIEPELEGASSTPRRPFRRPQRVRLDRKADGRHVGLFRDDVLRRRDYRHDLTVASRSRSTTARRRRVICTGVWVTVLVWHESTLTRLVIVTTLQRMLPLPGAHYYRRDDD